MIITKSSEKLVKIDENFRNLIFLNPPLNNQEYRNESKLKLNERSWMFMDFQILVSWKSEVVFNWLKKKK